MITLVFLGFLGFFFYSFYLEYYKKQEVKIDAMQTYINLQYGKKYKPHRYKSLVCPKVD